MKYRLSILIIFLQGTAHYFLVRRLFEKKESQYNSTDMISFSDLYAALGEFIGKVRIAENCMS
jgi:hypothetical protein